MTDFVSLKTYIRNYGEKHHQLQVDLNCTLQTALLSAKEKFHSHKISLGDLVGFLVQYFDCFATGGVEVSGERWDSIAQHLEVAEALYQLNSAHRGSIFEGEGRRKSNTKQIRFSFHMDGAGCCGGSNIDSLLHIQSLLWHLPTIVTSKANPQVEWFTIEKLQSIDYTSGHVLVELELKTTFVDSQEIMK